jgi:hypothetical protein
MIVRYSLASGQGIPKYSSRSAVKMRWSKQFFVEAI